MSLTNAVLKAGATASAPTGGTDVTFAPTGISVPNGLHIAVPADTDYRTRRNMTVKVKYPSLSNGVYSKDKKSITFVVPKILASGETVFNLIRIEREVHPESTAAEAFELSMIGAQILSDADFLTFWSGGSLA